MKMRELPISNTESDYNLLRGIEGRFLPTVEKTPF
jgi:hypothetical protein